MILKTTVYKTRDGQNFDDQLSAEIHETGLDLLGDLIRTGVANDGTLKVVCSAIAKNFAKYDQTLARLRTLTNKRNKVLTKPTV